MPIYILLCLSLQGNNATFSYFLLGSENRFTVDSLTGLITVNGSLDREKQENYSIVVRTGVNLNLSE